MRKICTSIFCIVTFLFSENANAQFIAPEIKCPGDRTVSTPANECFANVTISVNVTGSPTPSLLYSYSNNYYQVLSTSPLTLRLPVGTITVTITAINIAGRRTCSFTITVLDGTPAPVCPSNITVGTVSTSGAVVDYGPLSTINCGTKIGLPRSGSLFPIGTTTVNVYNNIATETVYGLTFIPGLNGSPDRSQLVKFGPTSPWIVSAPINITGLVGSNFFDDENIVDIDFRPSNGQLYGLGSVGNGFGTSFARLYSINKTTGVATQIGSGSFLSYTGGFGISMDFDPANDVIRVVASSGNIRLDPNTGTVIATDGAMAGFPREIAYSNNYASAPFTTLYSLSGLTNSLNIQGGINGNPSPNTGSSSLIGPLNISVSVFEQHSIGFDISQKGLALLSDKYYSNHNLYFVNLVTGAATLIGEIGNVNVVDIAIEPATLPVPSCSFTVTVTPPPLLVTINQASGQADPTNTSPVNFTAVFNDAVTDFTSSDVLLSGTAGATNVVITEIAPNNGTTYNIAVSGMVGHGNVIATIPADVVLNSGNVGNAASSSTDNLVTYFVKACPVANAQVLTVDKGGSVNFQLGGEDPDLDPLQYSATQPPAHGTLVVTTNTGAAIYTPNAGYCGPDEFKFKVYDGECYSGEATVSIIINCNQCPVALTASTTTQIGTAINIQLQASDNENDALTYSISQNPLHGTVTTSASGTAFYTPVAGYYGADEFKFKANDGECDGEATVTVIIVRCPSGKGYWLNHPTNWPENATPMLLGIQSYTKEQLLTILNTPVGIGNKADASLILAHQLIAAKLNQANGADTPDDVIYAIEAADFLIGNNRIPMKVRPNSPLGQQMVTIAAILESYNKALLTQACQTAVPVTVNQQQEITNEIQLTAKTLDAKLYPNPSTSYFNIVITSNDEKEKITVQVFDQYGRLISLRNNISNGSIIRIGDLCRPGVYYVRMLQGKQHKELKLIKLSD